MRAEAVAQPNIALIKYWGKRDTDRNLPAVGSISITLSELQTAVSVALDGSFREDHLTVNGEEKPAMLPRISACLDSVLGASRPRARVDSDCNFPIAAGLASSASAFAAVTVAAAAAGQKACSRLELARFAGRASGSAARSLYGGFVELSNSADTIDLKSLCVAPAWPLAVVVAITSKRPKAIGSTEAMEISRDTSPFYDNWVAEQAHDLAIARAAIADRDFARLAEIAEHNCLKMHSVMWASRPPTVFWSSATMQCLQTIRRLQADGCRVFFTIDAGPQVKAVCHPEDQDAVCEALAKTPGVVEVMTCGLGEGAREVHTL